MARYKFQEVHNNKVVPEGWLYLCDSESDLASPENDMVAALVASPASGKSQLRVRISDGTFKELVVSSGGGGGGSADITAIVPAYSGSSTYNAGDLVSYNDKIYSANENGITGDWNPAKWTLTNLAEQLTGKAPAISGASAIALAYTDSDGGHGIMTFYGKITPSN